MKRLHELTQEQKIFAEENHALVEYFIRRNRLERSVRKKSLAKKVVFFTLEESQRFLKFVYDLNDVLGDLIYVTLQYGLRRSEVLGITEDFLDFNKHLLKIERTVVTITSEHKKDKTKTPDSNRVYYLTPEMEKFFKGVIDKKKENLSSLQAVSQAIWKTGYDLPCTSAFDGFYAL